MKPDYNDKANVLHYTAPIVYYVTAHGYGHGVRSCDIINALHRKEPNRHTIVVSGLPESFFRKRLHGDWWSLRSKCLDVGLVQKDGVRADLPATLEALDAFCKLSPALIREEAEYLDDIAATVVVADIPGIPIAAAASVGIPSVAVGNFSWDWIYAHLAESDSRWATYADLFRRHYRQADLLLELPFSGDMSVFRKRVKIGLTTEPGTNQRAQIAAKTGVDPDSSWVLLAFTALDCAHEARRKMCDLPGYRFFTVAPLQWGECACCLRADDWNFSDLVASMDIIVSKPGYGIVSECVVNGKPLVHVERRDFIEAEVLEAGIDRYLRHVQIPGSSFYRGELHAAIEELPARPLPGRKLPLGGAATSADYILDMATEEIQAPPLI